ncbi:hypothetical protein [Rouxiella sp. WC2420]|uniref:SET domain-containing protein n=1 Tax=Rouxiella sp. WC2420 TaxID=3234145 RepID=A0AB39VWC6_9GAMM
MSDFSILGSESVLIGSADSTSMAAASFNPISNNILDLSHSTKMPLSLSPSTTADNQSSILDNCNLRLRHEFMCLQMRKQEVTNRLTVQQNQVLNQITHHADCLGAKARSVCAWLDYLPTMISNNIKLKDFADFCGVNENTLRNYISHEQRARLPLTASQQALGQQVVRDAQCAREPRKATQAWIQHQTTLQGVGITPFQFSRLAEVPPQTLIVLIKCLQPQRHLPQLTLGPRHKDLPFVDNIVRSHNCSKNSKESARAWLANQHTFEARGITRSQFASRCGVSAKALSKAMAYVKFRLRHQMNPVIKPVINPDTPMIAIKKEIDPSNRGIVEITLDESGNELECRIITQPRLQEAAVSDNSLPVYHHPENPRQNPSVAVLGLDSANEVKNSKVTSWGGMKTVFQQMPIKSRIKLEAKIVSELYQQIKDKSQNGGQVNCLMENSEPHSLPHRANEIIIMGIGVFNLGSEPIAANTVIDFYDGIFLEQGAAGKVVDNTGPVNTVIYKGGSSLESFNAGTLAAGSSAHNISTGKLAKEPLLVENNVAAVQVNSKLTAYVTLREIAVGEEYFVDYGVRSNPFMAIKNHKN